MSPRPAPVLFGLVRSALVSLIVSGIATLRNAGPVDAFIALRFDAGLPSLVVAVPPVLAVAPPARRLVASLVKASAREVR